MTRTLNNTLAAVAAVVLALTSFSAITSVPVESPVALAAAPVLA